MPVPRRRHGRARRNKKRANKGLAMRNYILCPRCGEPKLPHRVCQNCGEYKGSSYKVVVTK